jgi:hypothetical protein
MRSFLHLYPEGEAPPVLLLRRRQSQRYHVARHDPDRSYRNRMARHGYVACYTTEGYADYPFTREVRPALADLPRVTLLGDHPDRKG